MKNPVRLVNRVNFEKELQEKKLECEDMIRKYLPKEEGFAAHMILQVHDELDFECPIDEVERLTTMVRDVMEHVVDLRVPLIAEASTGVTWADAK